MRAGVQLSVLRAPMRGVRREAIGTEQHRFWYTGANSGALMSEPGACGAWGQHLRVLTCSTNRARPTPNCGLTDEPALVLNQNYDPLDVCRTRCALVWIGKDKAGLLENGHAPDCSVRQSSLWLPGIYMLYYVSRPRLTVWISRQ